MFIESVELYHYRNLDSMKINLSPGVNIFFGDNAQGKTNFLESVYVSSTTRSHRGSRDKDLICFDHEEAHIRVIFHKQELSHRMDVHLRKKHARGIAIDGVAARKSSQIMGMIPVVFFSPEDLSIIKRGPAGRRRFMDMELSQLDPVYLSHLIRYNKVLSERNNLLKQIRIYPTLLETLDGWNRQLLQSGIYIIKKRREFILHIDQLMKRIHSDLSGGKEWIDVSYECHTSEQEYEALLKERQDKDIESGTTTVGPHRDDIRFTIKNIDIRRFGSQGQQRTAALALKLSEIYLIEEMQGEKPVLLLDDVLSELDSHRQKWLLHHIRDIQTLVTCTGLDEFVNSRIQIDKLFRVQDGLIEEYKSN